MDKKTKIVATIGPATQSPEMLAKLLKAGFNVMRLNFSHGDFSEHQSKVDNLAIATKKTGIQAAVLQDLSGPKFRIGDFYQERVILKAGEYITLTPEKIVGDEKRVSFNYPSLADELAVGNIVMVDDGKKKFEVVEISGKEVKCKILIGGETKGRRGVNLPGAKLSVSSLTSKDKKDLQFGIQNKVDYVAFSFVRRAKDVQELRALLTKAKSSAKIISKIETAEAIENFDSILELSDGIMVARGDLAVEIGAENVPAAQKMMIKKCNEVGKPVITATQMLESMIKSPVPTRAEVSDIANAIFDGTDAVMLSEETTLGQFPVEAVEVMTKVAIKTENDPIYRQRVLELQKSKHTDVAAAVGTSRQVVIAIAGEVVDVANAVGAKAITVLTHSGFTARMISRYKPFQPVIALTDSMETYRQLLLQFGTVPVLVKRMLQVEDVLTIAKGEIFKRKFASKKDLAVCTFGLPLGNRSETTNTLLVTTL